MFRLMDSSASAREETFFTLLFQLTRREAIDSSISYDKTRERSRTLTADQSFRAIRGGLLKLYDKGEESSILAG